jgi:hypothetical protein
MKYHILLNSISYNGNDVQIMYVNTNVVPPAPNTLNIIYGKVDNSVPKKITEWYTTPNKTNPIIIAPPGPLPHNPNVKPDIKTYNLNIGGPTDLNQLGNDLQANNFYNTEFKSTMEKLIDDYINLEIIKRIFSLVNLADFDISGRPNESYKFILLNYQKMCEIISSINKKLVTHQISTDIDFSDKICGILLNP